MGERGFVILLVTYGILLWLASTEAGSFLAFILGFFILPFVAVLLLPILESVTHPSWGTALTALTVVVPYCFVLFYLARQGIGYAIEGDGKRGSSALRPGAVAGCIADCVPVVRQLGRHGRKLSYA